MGGKYGHSDHRGRRIGQPATELGLARIQDPDYPAVIANYANQFADGRTPARRSGSTAAPGAGW